MFYSIDRLCSVGNWGFAKAFDVWKDLKGL